MVQYPPAVYDGNRRSSIKSAVVFRMKYQQIMTPVVTKAVLTQSPTCLFGNVNGAMIGHGEIWFDETKDGAFKIKSIRIDAW